MITVGQVSKFEFLPCWSLS